MPQYQILLKKDDDLRLIGKRIQGRSTKAVANKVIEAVLSGYIPPTGIKEEPETVRCLITLPLPVAQRLEEISRTSGLSVSFIVRNMLGLDY